MEAAWLLVQNEEGLRKQISLFLLPKTESLCNISSIFSLHSSTDSCRDDML